MDNIFEYKGYTITVNSNLIKIDKSTMPYATLNYDRLYETETFSGEFPFVTRGCFIHRTFNEVIDVIGTSTKVTVASTPKVQGLLDKIK